MPIYFIFLIVAVLIAIYSDKIDKKVSANGKVKKIIIILLKILINMYLFDFKI